MSVTSTVRMLRAHRACGVTVAAAVYLTACAGQQVSDTEPGSLALTPDASWFQCVGRFDCVIVYDSNVCAERAVNTRHALEYESWVHTFMSRAGDSRGCAPDPDSESRAVCRNRVCDVADSNLDALFEYAR